MTRYWTADLHLGHANISKYSGRPFTSVEEMNRAIIDNWNETVTPEDEVWVLGDFAMGRIADTLFLARELAGNKTLVPGNHDRCWIGAKPSGAWDSGAWTDAYRQAGFTINLYGEGVLGEMPVLVDHFPYAGDSGDEDRYAEHRLHDMGMWILHGHVHEKWRQKNRQINVGVDAWGGRPVSDATLIDLILAGPTNLIPLEWT